MSKRIFIVAAEPSAFVHSAELIKALHQLEPSVEIFCWGDKQMEQAGAICLYDTQQLTGVGVVEILSRLPEYLRALRRLQSDVGKVNPDVVVLVDFPGFNMRAARMLHEHGYRIAYYIIPQVWAWGRWRIKSLKQNTDLLLCIIPFEPAFLGKYGIYHAVYVGNPVVEQIENFVPAPAFRDWLGVASNTPLIALLPGSRRSEVRRILPVILEGTEEFGREFMRVVCAYPSIYEDVLKIAGARVRRNLIVLKGKVYDTLYSCAVAVIASGTATLEAALIGTPQLVVYRVNWLTYLLGRVMIQTPFLSLVNNIAGRHVVPELIQHKCTPQAIKRELEKLLSEGEYQQRIQEGYTAVREALGTLRASARAAQEILNLLL